MCTVLEKSRAKLEIFEMEQYTSVYTDHMILTGTIVF